MAAWPKLKWDQEPTGPLKGIKVVDMATVVLGPLATVSLPIWARRSSRSRIAKATRPAT